MKKKRKIAFVVGIRPDGNKISPLYKTFQERPDLYETSLINTGQHGPILTEMLDVFKVKADYNLKVFKQGQTLFTTTMSILGKLEVVFNKIKPDLVFSPNDGTTSFVTALAAYYLKIPVAHVEAGLRTNNIFNPFPEEANRKMTSVVTTYNFAPTQQAKQNLLKENISKKSIFVSGNTIIDALNWTISKYENSDFEENVLNKIDYKNKKVILLTTHRRESWGKPMQETLQAIKKLVKANKDVEVIFPVHPNKIVQDVANQILKDESQIHLISPLSYIPTVLLMKKCYMIMTDSGGMQEEAPTFGKPILVLRKTTERPEGVKLGIAKLVGTDGYLIYKNATQLLKNEKVYQKMARFKNPYGDGKASARIFERISYNFNLTKHSPKEFRP